MTKGLLNSVQGELHPKHTGERHLDLRVHLLPRASKSPLRQVESFDSCRLVPQLAKVLNPKGRWPRAQVEVNESLLLDQNPEEREDRERAAPGRKSTCQPRGSIWPKASNEERLAPTIIIMTHPYMKTQSISEETTRAKA